MTVTKNEMVSLAVGLAAGTITEDVVLEHLGDQSLVNEVIAMAAGSAIGTTAMAGAKKVVQTTDYILDSLFG